MFLRSQIQTSLRRPDQGISRYEQSSRSWHDVATAPFNLDGYNNLDYWTGKSEKSAGCGSMLYDENDLMAV
jgi:hypothetical protein